MYFLIIKLSSEQAREVVQHSDSSDPNVTKDSREDW